MGIVRLPQMGTGVRSLLRGSSMKVGNPTGRLSLATRNVEESGKDIKQLVSKQRAKAERDAKINISNLINIKA